MPAANGKSIDYIVEKVDDISTSLQAMAGKFDDFKELYRIKHMEIVQENARAHSRLDRAEGDIVKMAAELREISRLLPWIRVGAYLFTGLSVPIILAAIAFIWSVITHKVTFP